MQRRLVGIDLGIASAHTVRVLAEDGREVCRRRCEPTVASLAAIESAALAGTEPGTHLEVVFEPTGPAWLPVAVFFTTRGHLVFRVSSAKAADLRRFLSRHAKSNGIDADTLARLPLIDPAGLQPLELPGAEAAALDRRVRAADRLTRAASEHKVRIKDLVRQLMPCSPLTGDLGQADLAVLERWADPRALLKAGPARLTALIAKASKNHLGADRAEAWRAAAAAAVELYGDHPALAFADLAAEVATEVRLLRAIQAELGAHAASREEAYRWADPGQLARSLPGLAEVGAPVAAAGIGRPGRFPSGPHFKSYLGLAPRASETGDTDRKGQPMSKAGSSLMRSTFIRAADHARKQDPQLARVYYVQMVERGAEHLKALCVVAGHLAERFWAVMNRGMPYVVCDTNGTPVTPEQAKANIAEQWTVPTDVRARRRSRKKAGKAPQQAPTGHVRSGTRGADERGDLPRPSSSKSAHRTVKRDPLLTADPR
ncbi:transposase [Blastococcus sp. BMG 814]|uniref:Transposase n=1 Tax=Blastococcus carthaginiensis TaxID=3050034 RepID=A0ABT9IGF9_9ACTN|nr:transposase [Blastococcus carthaginiensis]MDP5181560.1 transposase [Blastococcus carthaginiensis]MDP5184649.1 transposase [Blastococcus carthaginiensis]MDP5184650.1 transposase [Blastococcus carthaginiensis]MDP5184838.1 transposase [Blastococcus carthaginiensis]MDP5185391.1 transposase [Blastococcus carthaginiensis]